MVKAEIIKNIFNSSKMNNKTVMQNVKILHDIDKSLVPEYLDKVRLEQGKPGKSATKDDEYLKYLLQ